MTRMGHEWAECRQIRLRFDALDFHDDSPFPVSFWLLGGGHVFPEPSGSVTNIPYP